MSPRQVVSRSYFKTRNYWVSKHNRQKGTGRTDQYGLEDKEPRGVDLHIKVKHKTSREGLGYRVSHRDGSIELKLLGLIKLFTPLFQI